MVINSSIHFLENSYSISPDKTAIVHNGKKTTYKELRDKALKIASHIYNEKKNQPVIIILPKSDESIISFMATLYSGNFYCPVDIKNPISRTKTIIEDLEPIQIITNTKMESTIREIAPNINIINIDEIYSKESKDFDYQKIISRVIDTDPIYCIYTSGSTGKPKGVLISHRSVVDYINYAVSEFEINENTIFGNQAQFHFDISGLDIYGSFLKGGTINIIPETFFVFPGKLFQYIKEEKINFLYWVPTALNFTVKTDALKNIDKLDISHILFAGEPMPISTLKYLQKYLPNTTFANLYGPTEITITCTHYRVDRDFNDSESIPIGKANYNSDVFILDKDNNLISPKNKHTNGELCVRGSSLALGYWRDQAKTDEKFIQNPIHNNYPEKIYKTGDLVHYNENEEIIFVGRIDHQIKHMGYRIELEEIEREINSIKEIEVSCIFYDDESKKIVCAYSLLSSLEQKDLIKKIRTLLPTYMIPNEYKAFSSMPISSTGKIDRKLIESEIKKEI